MKKPQIPLPPVTDTLLYEYDFGDSWSIKITASYNCPDLIESGRITQAELDRAYTYGYAFPATGRGKLQEQQWLK